MFNFNYIVILKCLNDFLYQIVGAVLVVAFVLLLEQTEAVFIDFARLCKASYASHGFRRDSLQKQAIHFCYPTNTTNGQCHTLGKIKEIYLFIVP